LQITSKTKRKRNEKMILNIPLLCLTEADDDEVFLERDQEVISPPSSTNDNMDSRIGLDYIVENSDYVAKLAAALDTNNEIVKKQVFELLSALCAYSRSGYCRAIDTLENYKVNKARFVYTLFTFCALFGYNSRSTLITESQERKIPPQSGRHGAGQADSHRIQSGLTRIH
jgi:hypothetical protein